MAVLELSFVSVWWLISGTMKLASCLELGDSEKWTQNPGRLCKPINFKAYLQEALGSFDGVSKEEIGPFY